MSSLTNLLALEATRLSFVGFTAPVALPWATVLAVEYVGLRWVFRRELAATVDVPVDGDGDPGPVPRFAVGVLAGTRVASRSPAFGVEPVWVGVGGAVVLGARVLAIRHS